MGLGVMRQRFKCVSLIILIIAVVSGFGAGSPASALSCADIKGAEIDLGLGSLYPNQTFGRLLPEFKTKTETLETRERVLIKREAGKLFTTGGQDYVLVTPKEDGRSLARGVVGGREIDETTDGHLLTFDATKPRRELAAAIETWKLDSKDFEWPALPDAGDLSALTQFGPEVRIGQATQTLKAPDDVSKREVVKYYCSSDAEFAGNPDKLSQFVVIKGTIKAVSTTFRTVTQRSVDITVEDFVHVENTTAELLAEALSMFPRIATALKHHEQDQSDATDAQAVVPPVAAATKQPDPPKGGGSKDAVSGADEEGTQILREPAENNWATIFSLLAGLAAVVLGLLFLPQVRYSGQQKSAADTATTRETQIAEVAAPVANDNAERETVPEQGETLQTAKPMDASSKSETPRMPELSGETLQNRIEVLDTLRRETDAFRRKIGSSLDNLARDAADTEQAKAELEILRETAGELEVANAKLEEQTARFRREAEDASNEALRLKQHAAEMGVKLAKVTAVAETSRSIIRELESSSEAAVSLSAQYRDKSAALQAEAAEMRVKLDTVRQSASEQDELLKTTLRTSEELDRALVSEREERKRLSRMVEELERKQTDFQRDAARSTSDLKMAAQQARDELSVLQGSRSAMEDRLQLALEERRRAEAETQQAHKDSLRMRVDFNVKAKLLEDNVQALTAHIDALEQLLRQNGISVPQYLNVSGMFDRPRTEARSATEPPLEDGANIVSFRGNTREAG